jgi:hypothetical protein
MSGSVVSGNFAEGDGGGVSAFSSDGPIVKSTISGNTSNDDGGGVSMIFSQGFEIKRSTISGNTAGSDGGGVRAGSAALLIQSSTIAGNEGVMGGGIVANEQPTGSDASRVTLRYSTVTGNNSGSGGGIGSVAPASYEVEGSIVSANMAVGPASNCDASVTSDGHNWVGADCNAFSAPTDIAGINPHLLPLGDYGGPTQTVLPEADSDVIDAGGDGCPRDDQRGKGRPRGEACDVGSVEAG